MSQIEVPDWVVEVAAKVLGEIVMANSSGTTEHDDGVTIHMTKSVHELGEEALRAAIAAALGAWVVPVGYAGRKALSAVSTPPFYGCDAYISAAEQTDVVCDRIYYLRQEKPE